MVPHQFSFIVTRSGKFSKYFLTEKDLKSCRFYETLTLQMIFLFSNYKSRMLPPLFSIVARILEVAASILVWCHQFWKIFKVLHDRERFKILSILCNFNSADDIFCSRIIYLECFHLYFRLFPQFLNVAASILVCRHQFWKVFKVLYDRERFEILPILRNFNSADNFFVPEL